MTKDEANLDSIGTDGLFASSSTLIRKDNIMPQEKILVIDDEEDILELLRFNLSREGYQVSCAASGEEALSLVRSDIPNLILLDLMLPGMDGLEVARRLKSNSNTKNTPIVMLTAKGEEADIVAGLELGADDYVTKPFSPRVLVARVRAVLRRKAKEALEETSTVEIHDLIIDPRRHEVLVDGHPVQLTYTEFAILDYMARRPGWVFTRYQIVDAVRGGDYPVTDRSVDVQIVGLRKKLGPAGKYIETVRGIGYRFKE
jgi:two-component system phosphate regulon response regulator PhoB